jgi:hypothetical protein
VTKSPRSWLTFISTSVFPDDPPCSAHVFNTQYKCVHKNVPGNLYVGTKGVCFLGRVFFLEWTVIALWVDVVHLELLEKGIRVLATSQDSSSGPVLSHDFGDSFFPLHNPEQIYATFVSLRNEAVKDRTEAGTPTATSHSGSGHSTPDRAFRRLHSDIPLRPSVQYGGDMENSSTTGLAIAELEKTVQNLSFQTPVKVVKEASWSSPEPGTISSMLPVPTPKPTNGQGSTENMKSAWSKVLSDTTPYSELAVEVSTHLRPFIDLCVTRGRHNNLPFFANANERGRTMN